LIPAIIATQSNMGVLVIEITLLFVLPNRVRQLSVRLRTLSPTVPRIRNINKIRRLHSMCATRLLHFHLFAVYFIHGELFRCPHFPSVNNALIYLLLVW
jgi:hypothetical protein